MEMDKTWALKPNKMPKHHLIRWRNVGSLTFFVCISFVMAHKSRYLKSVNHKIVMWNTNRPRRLYFTILFFSLLFPYFPIFSLNCVCRHLFSAENFCFHVQFYPFIPVHGEVYSIQHYVIKFVSDLQQVDGFLWALWFPPPIKLKYCWKWHLTP
jgi:hypothetical protein